MTINRFYFDRASCTRKKLLTHVNIGIEIEVDKCLFVEQPIENLKYELQTVLIHAVILISLILIGY